MNLKLLKEFIELAKSEGVSELKYEEDKLKFEVSFKNNSTQEPVFYQPKQTQPVLEEKTDITCFHEVKSPFVGTFYASSSPGKPPFVRVGDAVKKGQRICILEAMKIMNEIESDRDGIIAEICVENESLVEYGQVLFKIK